jgi:hypothetical protein
MDTLSPLVPDFSDEHRRQLLKFGLIEEQILNLRYALISVKRTIAPRPAKNASLEVLDDIRELSDALALKLSALITQPTLAHQHVHGLLEERYWSVADRQNDDGATITHHLIPRLFALSVAAELATDNLPKGPTRVKSADPAPVERIENALVTGWFMGHRPARDRDDEERARLQPPVPPYPEALLPAAAENCAFRAIVGICYQSVGGTDDPLAALRAFLRTYNLYKAEAIHAMDAGIAEADRMQYLIDNDLDEK